MTFRRMSFVGALIPPELAPVIRKLPFVNYVNPDTPAHVAAGQDTSWGVKKVRAHNVWDSLGYTSQAAHITILDTGIDSTHLHNSSLEGPANVDPFDGCLYVPPDNVSCYDDHGHGTHVAGIMSARSNDTGWVGTAYYPAGFTSIKVCDHTGGCPFTAIAAGLDWAAEAGFSRHIVNMSLGRCEGDETLAEAVATAASEGVLLIAAAGNTPSCPGLGIDNVLWPAKYSSVMAVSGTLENDVIAPSDFSCPGGGTGGSRYGSEVEISAPFWANGLNLLGGVAKTRCGTSMAAPVVAAIAAMLWTQNQGWTASSIRSHLKNRAVPLGGSVPNQQYGYGRVDALNAIGVHISTSGPSVIWTSGNYTWTATASGGTGSYTYLWEYRSGRTATRDAA
jgi:subtilisin family serine protease